MSKLEGHLQQSMKAAGSSHAKNAAASFQSKVPADHPHVDLLRNSERFMHELRMNKDSKDEEIDDVFLAGLGESSNSKGAARFQVSQLLTHLDILDDAFLLNESDASG